MPAPRFLGYQALLGEPKPINWQGVGQALWDSNLNAPIRGAYNLMNTPYEVLAGGPSPELDQAVADSFDAAGGVAVGSMPIPKPANSLTMGIKAYHGSPHSFDKFSMDKIGTGEGAQAYGHGLYFAEKEGVAKSYRDTLSGKQYKFNADPKDIAAKYGDGAIDTFYKYEGDPKEIGGVISGLRQAVQKNLAEFGVSDVSQLKSMYDGDLASATIKMARNADNMEQLIKSGDIALDPGSMYEVNIDADPNAFLDWDKPLSEQPEAVRNAIFDAYKVKGWKGDTVPLREVMQQYEVGGLDPMKAVEPYLGKASGHQAYSALSDQMGAIDWPINADATMRGQFRERASAKTANLLKEAGIPGIKYLDAGSRGAGDGTRNYVVFDDKLISIVKKYGIAGASAMLGYDVLTGANEAQAKAVNKADLDHRYDNFLKSGGI